MRGKWTEKIVRGDSIVRGNSPEKWTYAEEKGKERKGKEQFGTEFVVI
jgi:hypothetical protein